MSRLDRVLTVAAGIAVGLLVVAGIVALRRDDGETASGDYSARFAGFEAAEEPNVDASSVERWPAFVLDAGPEVKRLYEFQLENGDLMRYMPCFCGCGRSGHRNNRDCFVRRVNADGSVVFDDMAPT